MNILHEHGAVKIQTNMLVLVLLLPILNLALGLQEEACNPIPGDAAWPSDEKWDSLNNTVEGRLIATIPIASICHDDSFGAEFDLAGCNSLRLGWNFSQTHYPFPGEFSFPYLQNQTCDPYTLRSKPCELGNYASYSINVLGSDDVVAGLRFAKQNNVRLVIKNTGHDYLGKSTGKGSLSLWTQSLKTKEIITKYQSTHYTGPALRLGAGVLAVEAYGLAHENGFRVVGGTCATVGIAGGYTQGGGHSTLSSIYGLAADNVLEWEVVTGEGEHVIAKPGENEDLYWALSGGGGGTFGVVLSMTVRIHKDGPISGARLQFNDDIVGNGAFWDAVDAFQASLPPILDTGISLLYSISNSTFDMFSLTAPNHTEYEVISLLEPILANLSQLNVPFTFQAHSAQSFVEHFARDLGPLPFGSFSAGQHTASRLIPRATIQDPASNRAVTEAFQKITASNEFFIACQALDVSGSNTGAETRPVAENAVLPAWRDTASHCIVVGYWDFLAPREEMERKANVLARDLVPLLEDVTPGSGTYLNEANFMQESWKEAFYGDNYEKLLAIKDKYDPDILFYATTAVGSDRFWIDDEGRLCRAQKSALPSTNL